MANRRRSTHAWAQVYLPRHGWIDFDPTSGTVGKRGLVTVAVVRDPRCAPAARAPSSGPRRIHLGMEVHVECQASGIADLSIGEQA